MFLADLMHRIRCFGKHVFGLALAPLSTSTCTVVDACRLKRNFGHWLLSCHKKSFDVFQEKSKAAVERHFNCHKHCDDWCNVKKANAADAAKGSLKHRCKTENEKMHANACGIMDRFTEMEKSKECHHWHSSQKNESMNELRSRCTPKDETSCQSTSLKSRTCLAVGADSVGQNACCERLFEKMKMPFPETTSKVLESMKKRRDHNRECQVRPIRKRRRSESKFENMKDGLKNRWLTRQWDLPVGVA
jgi:hypothetical protein